MFFERTWTRNRTRTSTQLCDTKTNEGIKDKDGNELKIIDEISCEKSTAKIVCLSKTDNDNSKLYAKTDFKSLNVVILHHC